MKLKVDYETKATAELRIYEEKWQEAVFGHMISDKSFFLKCRSLLSANWFQNPNLRDLASYYYKTYEILKEKDTLPTKEEVFAKHILVIPDANLRRSYDTKWEIAKAASASIRLSLIQKEMTAWIRLSKFKEDMVKAIEMYNNGKFQDGIDNFFDQIKKVKQISFDEDGTFKFDSISDFIRDFEEEKKDGLFTGHRFLDKLLVGDEVVKRMTRVFDVATQKFCEIEVSVPSPGLRRGDTTMLMGPANSGKTTLMITFIKHAIEQGKSVLYITHEQKDKDIASKIYKAVYEMNTAEISNASQTDNPEFIKVREKIVAKIRDHLTYKPHNMAGGMYVEDVVDLIRGFNEERKSKTGKGYDLIVNDYPAKLQSRMHKEKRVDHRIEQESIYDHFVQLALELNCHAMLGVQTNREGFKTSKKGDSFLSMDSVSESFGIMKIATNVITINRSDFDKANNLVTLYIAKSRSSETGTYFTSQTDMARSVMFGENMVNIELPGWSGVGSGTDKEVIDKIMKEKNKYVQQKTDIVDTLSPTIGITLGDKNAQTDS